MNALPGFASAAPGFDAPLELLAACHGRIAAQLATLERLVSHVAARGCDAEARAAALGVMRYFDTAGVKHHQDEEQDLFPVLRIHAADQGAAELLVTLEELQRDHRIIDAAYAALRLRLADVAEARVARLDAGMVAHFAWIYRRHIGRESENVLPFAELVLGAQQRARLGASMAARRGAAPATLGA